MLLDEEARVFQAGDRLPAHRVFGAAVRREQARPSRAPHPPEQAPAGGEDGEDAPFARGEAAGVEAGAPLGEGRAAGGQFFDEGSHHAPRISGP